MRSQLKCYLSAPANFDLTNIESVLDSQNVEHHSFYDFVVGITFADLITNKISDSDFVVAILEEKGSENVLFELGLAEGLKKPTFILASKAFKIPFFLDTKLYYQTNFEDLSLIELALINFITDLGFKKKSKPKNERDRLTTNEVDDILFEIQNLRERPFEESLINVIQILFSKIGVENVSFDEKINPFGRRADIVIRSKTLKPYFGNPIFIEVKSGVMSSNRILEAQTQLLKYIQDTEAKGGIIIYLDKNGRRFNDVSSLSPSILVFDIEDFVNGIASNGFERFLINERNKLAHGIK